MMMKVLLRAGPELVKRKEFRGNGKLRVCCA